MCTREPRLVLVSLLIGWKSGARTLNQSICSAVVMAGGMTFLCCGLLLQVFAISSDSKWLFISNLVRNNEWLQQDLFPGDISRIALNNCLVNGSNRVRHLGFAATHLATHRSGGSEALNKLWKVVSPHAPATMLLRKKFLKRTIFY